MPILGQPVHDYICAHCETTHQPIAKNNKGEKKCTLCGGWSKLKVRVSLTSGIKLAWVKSES
jgi:DNA-directed RNA polymerase subunit RPC12/RpoP